MKLVRAFTSRLEPTAKQREMFFAWTGVRKFAYNDARWRKQNRYARLILAGKKPIKTVFDLRHVARLVEATSSYKEVAGEWVFTLVDLKTNETLELRPSIHGFSGKHVAPDVGLKWLQARVGRIVPEPPTSQSQLRARYSWISEAPAAVYREACADLDDAFQKFWKTGAGYPRRDDGSSKRFRMSPGCAVDLGPLLDGELETEAITRLDGDYVEGSGREHDGPKRVLRNVAIQVEQRAIKFPGLGGEWVKLSRKGYLPTSNAKYSGVSVHERAGHWYVSLTATINVPDQSPTSGKVIGVDLGHRHLMVDSDGKIYGARRDLKKELKLQERIKRLGRRMTRQQGPVVLTKGAVTLGSDGRPLKQQPSNSWKRTKLELSRAHQKLSNMRGDVRHQATSRLVKKGASLYRVEDIGVQGMLAKLPTTKAHNKRLRKINASVGYHEIRTQISYKSKWRGSSMETHEPAYTSKQCPECGTIDFKMGSKEFHRCANCGFGITHGTDVPAGADLPRHHRDFSAAVTHRDPEKHRIIRDSAWAARHTLKGPAGSGLPDRKVEMGNGSKEQKSCNSVVVTTEATSSSQGCLRPHEGQLVPRVLSQSIRHFHTASGETTTQRKHATSRKKDNSS
jgi:IS605 OrfB family transposase